MKVTIIGTGYVGLVTGACLAEVGNEVLCLDLDAKKIEMLTQGRVPIFEPGLESMVASCVASGHLRFTTDIKTAVDHGGRHTNDRMLSFYMASPFGFEVEVGCDGLRVDEHWTPGEFVEGDIWGHRGL